MAGAGGEELPGAVLFACTMNSVRSPMAAGFCATWPAGGPMSNRRGWRRGLGCICRGRDGRDWHRHLTARAAHAADLHDTSFDLIVTLSPEAHHQALELTRTMAVEVEYWPTFDATLLIGSASREQVPQAYRDVRDNLFRRIKLRFGFEGGPSV